MRFVPEFGPDGEVNSVLVIGHDIHEIKENERRFRMLAENFPDLVVRFDRGGRYMYVNPAFEKAFGISTESIIGKTLQEWPQQTKMEPSDAPLAMIRHVLEEGIASESETRWDIGTNERIFENRCVPEKDATGNVINILCIARDVTEHKRSEEALRESEERYRQLVKLSPDSIAVYSQGRVVFANPATVRMVGAKSAEELIGRPVSDFIHPNFRATVKKSMEDVESAGIPTPFVEQQFLRLDGLTVDVEVAVVPYALQGVQYMQIVARDITERKHHEQERKAIITVSAALRKATTKAEILTVILDQLVELFGAEGSMIAFHNLETKDVIIEMGRGVVGERFAGVVIPEGKGVSGWVIANKKPYLNNHANADPIFYRPDLLGDSYMRRLGASHCAGTGYWRSMDCPPHKYHGSGTAPAQRHRRYSRQRHSSRRAS